MAQTTVEKKTLLQRILSPELLTYLSIAVVGFSVNIASRVVYEDVFGIWFGVSIVLAYATGGVVGFLLTKRFSFNARESNRTRRELVKFIIVTSAAMVFTYIMSKLFLGVLTTYFMANPETHAIIADEVSQLGYSFINRELLAHLAGTGMGFFVNFFGHKFFTFRTTGMMDRARGRAV